ncbi:uncharacterized protein LOC117916402 [Vitis riparia]|uniref:uncharacterized protein LOC117916402 n=1 Tax=Vitis riparia TaxID=96939 RepID=UPI00155A8624|nr:uncharacterized protein LOC117916402 [Vitis riparia]
MLARQMSLTRRQNCLCRWDSSTAGASFRNGAPGETQTEYGIVKLSREQGPGAEECSSLFPDGIVQSYGGSDRLMAAPAAEHHMSELGRFGSGTGVSLPLGLQHCEGGSLSISGEGHHGFAGMGEDDTYDPPSSFFSGY